MFKKLLALTSATMLMLSFSACKEEKADLPKTENTTSIPEISTTEVNPTKSDSTTKSTESQTITTATTKRETTTVKPTVQEEFNTSINTPNELYRYTDGKQEKVSPALISKIVPQINIYLNDTKLGVLKLAVDEDMIDKIKSENKAIELIYNSEQAYVMFQKTGGPDKYKFEKVLIPLDGERKGYVFFCKDGTYQHGPLKSTKQKAIEEISNIF